ncbi:MAG: hypothetical protein R3236_08115, partial [Phycisphaeraceae bacterium]|nr:hypothetical protein [Phycisphaeraceae bacterium]
MHSRGLWFWLLLVGWASAAAPLVGEERYDADPIRYSATEPKHDPVSKLTGRLRKGAAFLRYDEKFGYLPALLEALRIPFDSQVLVFSKTSLQLDQISPQTPRAVYFNDENYVGYVQGGAVLEIASVDPQLGTVFYTLDQRRVDVPKPVRATGDCLSCHASSRTRGVPGLLVRSVFPSDQGHPILRGGSYNTTQQSPIKRRWGGWYVSGKHIDLPHMGNRLVSDARSTPVRLDKPIGGPTDEDRLFDKSAYLKPTSDVAALMVLEH